MAIQYVDDESFKEQIKEGFVIVDFFSTTCVPCKAFSRILEELDAELPFINIVKVNTTDYRSLAKRIVFLGFQPFNSIKTVKKSLST